MGPEIRNARYRIVRWLGIVWIRIHRDRVISAVRAIYTARLRARHTGSTARL